jgi:hypothetical protein
LAVIGLGPVALLHRSVDRATRLALAPAFGLAVSACVLVTALWRVPGYKGWPLVLVLMALSVALAVLRGRRAAPDAPERKPLHLPGREALQLGVLVVVVLVALNLPLALMHTPGPAGGFRIADASGYVAEIDGAQKESIHSAKLAPPPYSDLTLQYWHGVSGGYQQIGFDAIAAYVNEMVGFGATDTHAPFLLCLILIGALAAWAAVRQVTATRSWAAVLAGLLFAGPFFRNLFMEGSQGAIAGIVMVIPTLLAGWWALRRRRFWDIVAFGVLAAGLQTLYPLFVPPLAVGGAIVLAVLGVRALVRNGFSAGATARAAGMLGGALVIAAAASPVAFERNVRYWKAILQGKQSYAGLPPYDLPPLTVPSWLLQTRELYFLPHLGGQPFSQLIVTLALPAMLLAVIVYGLLRNRVALAAAAPIVAAIVLANQTQTSEGCSYCAQRSLLVVAPLAMVLIGIGLAAMRARGRTTALLVLPVSLLTLVAVGNMARHTILRTMYGSYLFDEQITKVMDKLPDQKGPVEVEGFADTYLAPMIEPLAYHHANEATDAPLSLPVESDPMNGLIYLGGKRPIGTEFRPDYKYIVTRMPDVRVPTRRTVARSGPVALQERTGDLDATLLSGTVAPQAWQQSPATAWVPPAIPLQFYVLGNATKAPWLRLKLKASVAVGVSGAGVTWGRSGDELTVCIPSGGPPPVRRAAVAFGFVPAPSPPPRNEYAVVEPPRGLQLTEMAPSATSCRSPALKPTAS